MNLPRDHYVAQFHLRLFLPDGDTDGKLHVYHKTEGLQGREAIGDIAQETGLYPPDIDKQMKLIEGRASHALRDIADGKPLHSEERREHLIDYVAMTLVRNPVKMRGWVKWLDDISLQYPDFLEDWLAEVDQAKVADRMMNRAFPQMRAVLSWLEWEKATLQKGHDLFISDKLVVYSTKMPKSYIPNRKTFVFMPISPRVALFGFRNRNLVDRYVTSSEIMRRISFITADQLVFSGLPIPDFDELRSMSEGQ
jgi:hypothetical protein